MRKMLLSVAIILAFPALNSCGYDGWYRYPCQDPDNWESPECQRPLCEIGTGCSDELVGREVE